MTHYAFIDESGTKFDQQVMTVSLVVLPSMYAHTKIQKKVLKGIYENYEEKAREARASRLRQPEIHFTEMENDFRLKAARVLAQETSISVITSIHYHDGCPKTSEEFYDRYQTMVRLVVADAVERYEDLELFIAFISAFKGDYQARLRAEIEDIRKELDGRHGFRKLDISFPKAVMPGIQLADFYAGARREHLLSIPQRDKSDAYDCIEHHYIRETIS